MPRLPFGGHPRPCRSPVVRSLVFSAIVKKVSLAFLDFFTSEKQEKEKGARAHRLYCKC